MGTNRSAIGKKHIITAVLAGVVILGISALLLAKMYVGRAETRMLKTANYMKVQCSTYTHYNNGSETQALLRAVESSNQLRDKLRSEAASGTPVSEERLKEYAAEMWVHGILVLDENGVKVCGYADDEETEKLFLEKCNMDIITTGKKYSKKSYTQRIYLDNGGYINMAATAREDAPGMLIAYYYITPDCAHNYSLTLQSLLDGYQKATDGTIMVADEGKIIACNDVSVIGHKTKDNDIVQTIKEAADSRHIVHVPQKHSYGVMLKQRDYYIYNYMADSVVFSGLAQNLVLVLVLYLCVLVFLWILLISSDRKYYKQEQEQAAEYHRELEREAKRADEANSAKTRFLQRMSHDIRTPINGIRGMLQVAEFYSDNMDKQAECRKKIGDASNLLLELVNEVLDMGKLESGEIVLDNRRFDLNEIMDEVITVIEKLASEQGVTIDDDRSGITHNYLIGSVPHIKRVLMNIMGNAVKYNKPGGSIKIRSREFPGTEEGTVLIEFVCSDTGIGMSKEYQERIFEPFTREDESMQTQYGGTGLGMPIAKEIVNELNGTITFESEEGKGTTFVVKLPFKLDTKKLSGEEKRKAEGGGYSINGCNVLLVEDNELNMEIFEFILQTEGAAVTKAWNGKEAVDAFANSAPGEFDAIIMDVMMPVMGGYEATERIRTMDRADAKTIPIIAMTANAFNEDRISSREAGMNAHLAKPLDSELLIETLYKLIYTDNGGND